MFSWMRTSLFHVARPSKAQSRSQREQNGSEVQSVELERLTSEGMTLIERRNGMELFRDQAAERFEVQTGSPGVRTPDRWSAIARSPPL